MLLLIVVALMAAESVATNSLQWMLTHIPHWCDASWVRAVNMHTRCVYTQRRQQGQAVCLANGLLFFFFFRAALYHYYTYNQPSVINHVITWPAPAGTA